MLEAIQEEMRKRNIEPPPVPEGAEERPTYGPSPLAKLHRTFCSRSDGPLPSLSEFEQQNAAAHAKLMLAGFNRPGEIIQPTPEEWIGINVLERDGKL